MLRKWFPKTRKPLPELSPSKSSSAENDLADTQPSFRTPSAPPSPDNSSCAHDDYPEQDGTDAAHPAWWRGSDWGSVQTAKALLRVASGDLEGTFTDPSIQEAAKTIQELRHKLEKAESDLVLLQSSNLRFYYEARISLMEVTEAKNRIRRLEKLYASTQPIRAETSPQALPSPASPTHNPEDFHF